MSANIRNFNYVVILWEDMQRMRVLYHEALGFPIYRDLDGRKSPDSASVQLAFRVAPFEVDGCCKELLRKRVEINEAPHFVL